MSEKKQVNICIIHYLTDCRRVDWFFHKCMRCRCSKCRWLQPSVACGGSNSNRACSPRIWGQSTKMIWWQKHRLVMELWHPCCCTFASQLLLCVNANDNDVICYPLLCTLPACLSYLLLFWTWIRPRLLRTQTKIMYLFSRAHTKKAGKLGTICCWLVSNSNSIGMIFRIRFHVKNITVD